VGRTNCQCTHWADALKRTKHDGMMWFSSRLGMPSTARRHWNQVACRWLFRSAALARDIQSHEKREE